jgi:hypothetical protein
MYQKTLFLILPLILLVSGCVGGPEPDSDNTQSGSPPDWVLKRPPDDSNYFYFIGTGTSEKGDESEAGEIAIAGLFADIMRYIGVTVTVETEATAKAGLDEFEASIIQTVTQEGSARVVGFELIDKWIDYRNAPAVTIHLLSRYDRDELEKEKARIEALFIEKYEAISGPEKLGQEYVAQGRYYEAAIQFIIAASAAYKSDVANADIKFKRNIDQAMVSIEKINLIKINDNLIGLVGQSLPEAFQIKVVTGGSLNDTGIPNVAIRVFYQEFHEPTGKMKFKETSIKTDENGIASFIHPVPQFVGPGTVTFSLDLESYMEGLDDIPPAQEDLVAGLQELIIKKKAVFDFTVTSNAGNIKTGILVIDYDQNGNIIGINSTAASIQSQLYDFNLMSLSISLSTLQNKSREEIISLLKRNYGGSLERIIFGTVKIIQFTQSDGKIFAKASGTIEVQEISTGNILYTVSKEKSGMGDSNMDAQDRAFNAIGELFGQLIKNNLK